MTSSDKGKTCGQLFFDYYWGSGFLPSRYQGVRFRNTGDLVPYLANPPGVSPASAPGLLDDIAAMNAAHLADYGDPEIDTRIAQYEMAFRMQIERAGTGRFLERESRRPSSATAPTRSTKGTLRQQLPDRPAPARTRRALRAAHALRLGPARQSVHAARRSSAKTPTRPLRPGAGPQGSRHARRHARRLGRRVRRTPFGQGDPAKPEGRDHFGKAFSWWLAGGGVKAGTSTAPTDDFAWNITQKPVHVHDMQATMLHLCGIDPHAFDLPLSGPAVPPDGRATASAVKEILV